MVGGLYSNWIIRYGTGLVSVAVAAFGTLLMWPVVRPTATPLFLAAIVITAWRAGLAPAILATLLSGLVIDYLFITPQYQLSGGWDDLSRLAVFTIEGSTLSWLIVTRRQIGDQVRQSREELRALSTHLQSMIEKERGRIAREIHDELGQELTGLKFDISWLRSRAEQNADTIEVDKLNGALAGIDGAIRSVRRIATELRPAVLDTLGLTAAIEWQARDFEQRTGIQCRLESLAEDLSLDQERATALFRIFQESLTNVARHAGATEVIITLLRTNGHLRLALQDDGKGIERDRSPGSHSLGILGMQERARLLNGKITIAGEPGLGTKVTVDIPLVGD